MTLSKLAKLFVAAWLFAFAVTGSAHAHIGHLGDLGGHSHWIGVGAVIVAGALGAMLGRGKARGRTCENGEEETPHDEELAGHEAGGETASA